MLKHKGVTLDHALNKIKSNRPEIQPCTFNCVQLQEYEQHITDMKKYNSKFGCLNALLNGKYFGGGRQDIIEKISHNWIQLIIYFLIILFLFRLTMQVAILLFFDDDDSEERNRLPCS